MGEEKNSSPRAGRPTQAEALRRIEALLDIATRMFLDRGYERTTLVDIARTSRIATRTIYARFPDKAALFAAVFERLAHRDSQPIVVDVKLPMAEGLLLLAEEGLHRALTPGILSLYRLIMREGYKFPELSKINSDNFINELVVPAERFFSAQPSLKRVSASNRRWLVSQFFNMIFFDMNTKIAAGIVDPGFKEARRNLERNIQMFCRGIADVDAVFPVRVVRQRS